MNIYHVYVSGCFQDSQNVIPPPPRYEKQIPCSIRMISMQEILEVLSNHILNDTTV